MPGMPIRIVPSWLRSSWLRSCVLTTAGVPMSRCRTTSSSTATACGGLDRSRMACRSICAATSSSARSSSSPAAMNSALAYSAVWSSPGIRIGTTSAARARVPGTLTVRGCLRPRTSLTAKPARYQDWASEGRPSCHVASLGTACINLVRSDLRIRDLVLLAWKGDADD